MAAKKVKYTLNWHLRTWSLGFVSRTVFPTKVVGRENIPKDEAFVFAIGPHKTYRETVLVPAYLSDIEFHIMAKESLFQIPGFGVIFKNAGGIPVVRSEGRGANAIAPAVIELLKGYSVMVYPEGTHHKGDGYLHSGKTGAVRIALEAGVRIIPIGLRGMVKVKTKIKRSIHIGAPFNPRDEMHVLQRVRTGQLPLPDGKAARQLTDRLMKVIAELSGTAYGEQDEQDDRA
jgi:1-acyl-sn-glycerol-3-phosphate acyltransferase